MRSQQRVSEFEPASPELARHVGEDYNSGTYVNAVVDPLGLHVFAVQVAVLLEVTVDDLVRDARGALLGVVENHFAAVAANDELERVARGLHKRG